MARAAGGVDDSLFVTRAWKRRTRSYAPSSSPPGALKKRREVTIWARAPGPVRHAAVQVESRPYVMCGGAYAQARNGAHTSDGPYWTVDAIAILNDPANQMERDPLCIPTICAHDKRRSNSNTAIHRMRP